MYRYTFLIPLVTKASLHNFVRLFSVQDHQGVFSTHGKRRTHQRNQTSRTTAESTWVSFNPGYSAVKFGGRKERPNWPNWYA